MQYLNWRNSEIAIQVVISGIQGILESSLTKLRNGLGEVVACYPLIGISGRVLVDKPLITMVNGVNGMSEIGH